MEGFNGELKFIKKHQEEIIPVAQERELIQGIEQHESAGE